MPRPNGQGAIELSGDLLRRGPVRATEVVLRGGDHLDAGDGIELRAGQRVHLAGSIRAGPGGVVISAGQSIEIDGELVAAGPIELRISEPDGEIVIRGSVVSSASADIQRPPLVLFRGRGGLRVAGRVQVAAASGLIQANLYGDITVDGRDARILGGPSGRVELSTTGALAFGPGTELVDEAEWSLRAAHILMEPHAHLRVARLEAISEGMAHLGDGAELAAGARELAVVGHTLILGSSARVLGEGPDGTSIRLEAGEAMEVGEGALLESRTPGCGRDGQIRVLVGGPFFGQGRALFRSSPAAADCTGDPPPGVVFVAQRFDGELPLIETSSGAVNSARIDPDLRVTVPPTDERSAGRWLSTPFPGGSSPPRLTAWSASEPLGTSVRLSLGRAVRAEGPGQDFEDYDPANPGAWERHAGADWLVVRVELEGARYDAPTVDHLELTF